MDINIDKLLKGKATKIKNDEFFQTESYITPFLERVDKIPGVKYTAKVELPKQITVTKTDDIDFDDITYNRVWLQAQLPEEYQIDNHTDVIGMVYGIDVRKPVVKFYRGGLNMACTNLCVFEPDMLRVQPLEASKAINYHSLEELINKAGEIKVFLDKLNALEFINNERNINESLGRWIRNCLDDYYDNGITKAKLATTTAIDAYKLLFKNAKSPYFVEPDKNTNMFNVYNAFTEIISNKDKDIMNKCEKVLTVKSILGIE